MSIGSFVACEPNGQEEPVTPEAPATLKYFSYEPRYVVVAPMAVSGNGKYVCGTDNDGFSYILDVETEEALDIEGISMQDVDNNGNGYGYKTGRPAVYENGEVKILDNTKTGTLFACTSDGSRAVGYWGYKHAAVYENGVLDTLLSDAPCLTGPYDPTDPEDWYAPDGPYVTSRIETGTALGVGDNGVTVGWFQDDIWSIEIACWWDAEGGLHMIGTDKAEYMPEERWFKNVYGGRGTKVSPNGKYIAGTGPFGVFMIDPSTGVMTEFEQSTFAGATELCAVSNEGHLYFNGAEGAMIYTEERGCELLERYLVEVHNAVIEPSMSEMELFVSVSDDERAFVFCTRDMSSLIFTTHVYRFE